MEQAMPDVPPSLSRQGDHVSHTGLCPDCGHPWDDHVPQKVNLPKNADGDVVVESEHGFMFSSGFDHFRGQGECRVQGCKCKAIRPNDPGPNWD